MRDHYDFAGMKGTRNPCLKRLRQPVTICMDKQTITYFKRLAEEHGLPYQDLINLYLRDCASKRRKLKWTGS